MEKQARIDSILRKKRTYLAKDGEEKLLKYYNDHEDRIAYKTLREKGYLIG